MDASFRHDSGWSTVAIGKKYNNPGNMRCSSKPVHNASCVPHSSKASWGSPTGPWSKYPTLEDGIWGNVALYARKYKTQDAEYFMDVWVQTADEDSDYANAIRACFTS